MPKSAGMRNDGPRSGGRAIIAAATLALGLMAMPTLARAQFFWDQPRLSADDAARAVMARGFRVLARPERNDDVYVAEVVDRRGVRERLIIASDTGQILQRFYVDAGRGYRRYADPTIPPGPLPPGTIPNDDREPSLLSKLFGNDEPPAAAAPAPDQPFIAPDHPARPPRARRPRIVEQTPGTVHDTPVESAPLAPPSAAPSIPPHGTKPVPPIVHTVPAQAALPPPAATAPVATPGGPVRSISTNPLAIPGSREQDEKTTPRKPAEASAAAPPKSAAPVKLPVPPAVPAAPAKDAVPVAPLE